MMSGAPSRDDLASEEQPKRRAVGYVTDDEGRVTHTFMLNDTPEARAWWNQFAAARTDNKLGDEY